jgi:hypothetical protein
MTIDVPLCYTPIRFIKTEVIDVERSMGQLGTETTVTGKFIEERNDPVHLGFDYLIFKEKASAITKGRIDI